MADTGSSTDTVSTQGGPFDINAILAGLKNIPSDTSALDQTKLQGKNAISLAQLQGQLQQQLAAQQNQYQLALQAQQNAYQAPFTAAGLTGTYNGAPTLANQAQQNQNSQFYAGQTQNQNQFNQTQAAQTAQNQNQLNEFQAGQTLNNSQFQQNYGLSQAQFGLQQQIQTGQLQLAQLAQQQQNAIAQGNLDLANQIQNKIADITQQNNLAQQQNTQAQTSGFMANGQMTEQQREAQAQQQLAQTNSMGVDAQGNQTLAGKTQQQNNAIAAGQLTGQYIDPTTGQPMTTEQANEFQKNYQLESQAQSGVMANGQYTDQSQQWRQQQALSALQTQAQLQSNPSNYFESAMYNRGLQGSGALTFMPSVQNLADGSNAGFRSANNNLPQTGSLQALASGQQTGTAQPGAYGMAQPIQGAQQAPNASGDSGPSASVANAQNAYQGNQAAYTNSMNVPSMQSGTAAQMTGQQGGQAQMAGQMGMYGQGQDLASQQLAAFRPTFAQGAQKLAPGSLEAMNPSEKSLFESAAGASGINAQDFETQYKRSRLQTGVGANQL